MNCTQIMKKPEGATLAQFYFIKAKTTFLKRVIVIYEVMTFVMTGRGEDTHSPLRYH